MRKFKLFNEVVKLSVSNDWDTVKNEWSLKTVYFGDVPHVCLCGHYPIIELCVIKNKHNGSEATVGNCCVKKFMGLSSDKIFTAVKRVIADGEKSMNIDTIIHAYKQGWINAKEYGFYRDIFKKRKLSDKQMVWKVKINRNIINRMNRG